MAKRKMETETAEIPTNETVKLSDMDASEPVGERPTPQDTRHLTAIRLDELGAAQERARALDQQLAIAAELMAGMIASGDRRGMGERARDAVAGAKALLDENMK